MKAGNLSQEATRELLVLITLLWKRGFLFKLSRSGVREQGTPWVSLLLSLVHFKQCDRGMARKTRDFQSFCLFVFPGLSHSIFMNEYPTFCLSLQASVPQGLHTISLCLLPTNHRRDIYTHKHLCCSGNIRYFSISAFVHAVLFL